MSEPTPEQLDDLRYGAGPAPSQDAIAEAQEVARLWDAWSEQEVAVVVFVRSRGADAGDARDRAVAAVQRGLRLGSGNSMHLETTQRGQVVYGAQVVVDGVSELGRAASNGQITVQAAKRGFE